MWFVYVCNRSSQLYTGITTNLGHRIKQHKTELLYSEKFANKHDAVKREREIIRLYYQLSTVIVRAMEKDEGFKEEIKELIGGKVE